MSGRGLSHALYFWKGGGEERTVRGGKSEGDRNRRGKRKTNGKEGGRKTEEEEEEAQGEGNNTFPFPATYSLQLEFRKRKFLLNSDHSCAAVWQFSLTTIFCPPTLNSIRRRSFYHLTHRVYADLRDSCVLLCLEIVCYFALSQSEMLKKDVLGL